jgi:hypothetical protein
MYNVERKDYYDDEFERTSKTTAVNILLAEERERIIGKLPIRRGDV